MLAEMAKVHGELIRRRWVRSTAQHDDCSESDPLDTARITS